MLTPEALFIVVNYHSQDCAEALIESLEHQVCTFWQCRVVNNGGPIDRLSAAPSSRIRIIEAPENPGYFGGARLAADDWLEGHTGLPEWTIVCNADVIFEESFLCDLLHVDSDVVAPAIISTTGADENPYMHNRPGYARTAFRLFMLGIPGLDRITHSAALHRRPRRETLAIPARPIYAPYGAVIALNQSFFSKGGTLAHGTLLFAEEITIAETSRLIGATISYQPSLRAYHREHASTGGKARSAAVRLMQRQSVRYAARLLLRPGRASAVTEGCGSSGVTARSA